MTMTGSGEYVLCIEYLFFDALEFLFLIHHPQEFVCVCLIITFGVVFWDYRIL